VRPLGGHQRQLVERERVHRPIGKQEGDALRVTLLDVLNDALVALVGFGVAKRAHVLERLDLPSAHRDQERVVVTALSAARMHDLRVAIDPGEGVLDPVRIVVGHDPLEPVSARRPRRERLADREWADHQLVVWRDELDVDRAAQQPAQPQQAFDGRDSAAAHDNSKVTHRISIPSVERWCYQGLAAQLLGDGDRWRPWPKAP